MIKRILLCAMLVLLPALAFAEDEVELLKEYGKIRAGMLDAKQGLATDAKDTILLLQEMDKELARHAQEVLSWAGCILVYEPEAEATETEDRIVLTEILVSQIRKARELLRDIRCAHELEKPEEDFKKLADDINELTRTLKELDQDLKILAPAPLESPKQDWIKGGEELGNQ